jgi:hypothetical protein
MFRTKKPPTATGGDVLSGGACHADLWGKVDVVQRLQTSGIGGSGVTSLQSWAVTGGFPESSLLPGFATGIFYFFFLTMHGRLGQQVRRHRRGDEQKQGNQHLMHAEHPGFRGEENQ